MYSAATKKLTPVMRQYRDAKVAYPDAILFFRLGDFYEMFNDDAVLAARELSLTLTSRNKGAVDEVPMAGVPYHSAHNYLAKLLARGHKVAICEQMADPATVKGIVPRKVVRVLTPAMVTDGGQLDPKKSNYLCALDGSVDDGAIGFALLDLSTGELAAATLASASFVLGAIARADPAETLLPEELGGLARAIGDTPTRSAIRADEPLADAEIQTCLDDAVATPLYADAVRTHDRAALRATARALRFARRCLPDSVLPVRRLARHDPDSSMLIDETAQTHLELVRGADGTKSASLLDVIDTTVTAPGARQLRRQLLAPLTDVAAIRRRLDRVELFVRHPRTRDELRDALARVGDLERLAVRASLREVAPRELTALRASLEAAPAARSAVSAVSSARADMGAGGCALATDVDVCDSLYRLLERALVDEPPPRVSDGGIIRDGHDSELDELRRLRKSGSELVAEMERRLRSETGIGSLKIKYTRAFGWYIEVTKSHLAKVPDHWKRRQTLTGAERYIDDALEELADKLVTAEERFAEREAELFDRLVEEVARQAEPLRKLASAIADWDVCSALAETAHRHGYARPDVDDSEVLALRDARHPVVERHVAAGSFVPNDTVLDLSGERLWIVTGPNMAGKSTLMRQVALNTILAQMGSFVAAAQARIGVVDRVLSRVGASDNLARGESTFMVEMRETAAILSGASRRSLVILDEIGRGTSTYDGLAIAWAVAEHLYANVGCRALFATHYHQLTELGERHAGIANYSVSAREHDGEVIFLHRLTRGAVEKSYGIAVAKLAGLPAALLARAAEILEALELGEHVDGGPGAALGSSPQLDLFRRNAPASSAEGAPAPESDALAERLRRVDPDRMTPLEALGLVTELKRMIE